MERGSQSYGETGTEGGREGDIRVIKKLNTLFFEKGPRKK